MSQIRAINHVTLPVADKERARLFYVEVLGLEPIYPHGSSLWMRVGNQFLHLSQARELEKTDYVRHLALDIEDLDIFIDKLMWKGIEIFDLNDSMEPIAFDNKATAGRSFIKDPDGNLIELIDSRSAFFHPKA